MTRESLNHLLRTTLCACLLMLGGCVHATRATFVRHYDLGASTPVPANAGGVSTQGQVLEVSSISVPDWLAGTAMYYRLDYEDDRRVEAYGRSDWVAPPATLLEPIIQRAIAAGGGWRAVVGPRNPATADASLDLQLDDFSQAFPQPGDSTGVVDATATLIDNHDGSVIAQRHFHVEVRALMSNAKGGVEALAKASRQFAAQVQSWLHKMAATGS